MSDTDDGVLPDKDYQPDLPTGTAPDRQRRIAWADANPETVAALIAGTLVAVPVEPTEAMKDAGGAARIYPSVYMGGPSPQAVADAVRIYRAMIAEHGRAQPRGTAP